MVGQGHLDAVPKPLGTSRHHTQVADNNNTRALAGYMSPEQFRGAAEHSSDLYGLGATLLYLLSGGKNPSAFPQTRLRIEFRSRITVGPRLATVLEGLLDPLPEDRLTATEAKNLLLGRIEPPPETRGTSGASTSLQDRQGVRPSQIRYPPKQSEDETRVLPEPYRPKTRLPKPYGGNGWLLPLPGHCEHSSSHPPLSLPQGAASRFAMKVAPCSSTSLPRAGPGLPSASGRLPSPGTALS